MTLPRRALLQGSGAAMLAGLVAGCARIPTASPISATPLADPGQPGTPYVQALPPAAGASPSEVVAGFVQAGVGPGDDFAVAREYLTDAERERWSPASGVTVYSGSQELEITAVSERAVSLSLETVAVVDGSGVRSQPAAPLARTFAFELERVEDQWRIASAPDGICLSEAAFATLYAPARLYFTDPRSLHLVPDHRWFAVHDGPAAVLRALVEGPQPFLARAVANAVPATSGVADAAVAPGGDGTTQVEVPAAVAALPAQARALALAQLEASLRSLRTLSDVQLVWRGPDRSPAQEASASRTVAGHRPIGAGTTGVVSLADPGAASPAQLVPDLAGRALRAPQIAPDGVLAAAYSADGGTVLLAATDRSFPLREAAASGGALALAVDDAGRAWIATRGASGALLALSRTGGKDDAALEAGWLAGRQVRSLAIAPDATRLLIVSAGEGGGRIDLCAIEREAAGAPRALSEPVPVRTGLTDVAQAGWYDETAVLCLGSDGTEARARVIDLAGETEPLPTPRADTDSLAGTAVADAVWASTAAGELLRTSGGEWVRVRLPASDPAFY